MFARQGTSVVLDLKAFFHNLYKHDYKISVVTSYKTEYALAVLDTLKIGTYISLISEDNNVDEAIANIHDAKNILVISSKKDDILAANNNNVRSCLVCFGDEIDEAIELAPTHLINKATQLDQIIII